MLKQSKEKILSLCNSLQPLSSPKLVDCLVYLSIPLFLILNLFKVTTYFLPSIDMLYIKFFIALFGVTYAYKDLNPYIKNVSNLKTTIKVSVKLFIAYGLFVGIAIIIIGNDPQNLKSITLSNTDYYLHLLELPFTAIGEEVLKSLMLLAFIRLFKPLKNINIILAIFTSAAIFGLLHINYDYSNALGIVFSIGFSSIPVYLFLLYYKSIYPVIIVHFIVDFFALSNISANFSILTLLFQLICITVILIFLSRNILNLIFKTKTK